MAKTVKLEDGSWVDIDPQQIKDNPLCREFFIVREFHSLAIVAYGWTADEAWRRAGEVPSSQKEGAQYFMTVILVDKPEGW